MTFEDYIRTQIELRSKISVRLGFAKDGKTASIMTWSDKSEGTHFWDVEGDTVKHIAYLGDEREI